jgi:hypothetical protein
MHERPSWLAINRALSLTAIRIVGLVAVAAVAASTVGLIRADGRHGAVVASSVGLLASGLAVLGTLVAARERRRMIFRLKWYEARLIAQWPREGFAPSHDFPPPFDPKEAWLAVGALVDLEAYEEADQLRHLLVRFGWDKSQRRTADQ